MTSKTDCGQDLPPITSTILRAWLRQRRYTDKTIVERIRLLACWTHWAREKGYAFDTVRAAHAASFGLIDEGYRPRFRGDVNKDAVETGKLFIAYLEDRGALPRMPVLPVSPIVDEYMAWAREQQGLAETTLGTYATRDHPVRRRARRGSGGL